MKKEVKSIVVSTAILTVFFGLTVPVQAQPVQPYTVQGYVYDTDGVTPVDGVNVIVTELNTSDSLSSTTAWGGFYYVTFGWPTTGPVYIGDQLQINATYGLCLANTTIVTVTGASPQIVNLTLQAEATLPAITNLQPANGSFINDSFPAICANYSDPTGINTSSVIIKVDGVDVTASAIITATGVCYTPPTALSEGLHTVIVNVSDICGNTNFTSWSFTVDTIPPTVVFIDPTPANGSVNTTGYVNVTVEVTDPTPGSGLEDIVNISVWNETGLYLYNTTYNFDEHKYYYNVSAPDGTPLPNGNYTYEVYAKDLAGNMGVSETRVVTVNVTEVEYNFTIDLVTGYDMVSMPVNDTSVTNASALIGKIGGNCVEIYKWNRTTQTWESYNPYMPPQAAFEIVGGEGYFVRMSGPASVEFTGKGWESPFAMSLSNGYNMIGIPVNDTSVTNASALIGKIGGNCVEIYKWNRTTQTWESYNPYMPPQAAFEIVGGEGYFVRMNGPADVTFEGGPWHN